MFLKGNNVFIRALEPLDSEILFKWENNVNLWEVSNTQIPFSKFVLNEFVTISHQDIYTNKQLRLMLGNNNTNEALGVLDLFEFDPQHARCGLGIYINDKFQRNGFAEESITLIISYAFKILHLKQIFVHVAQSNTASIALFEKLGFEKNGLKKAWHKKGLNQFEDVWFMQLINKGD